MTAFELDCDNICEVVYETDTLDVVAEIENALDNGWGRVGMRWMCPDCTRAYR